MHNFSEECDQLSTYFIINGFTVETFTFTSFQQCTERYVLLQGFLFLWLQHKCQSNPDHVRNSYIHFRKKNECAPSTSWYEMKIKCRRDTHFVWTVICCSPIAIECRTTMTTESEKIKTEKNVFKNSAR